MKYNNSFILEVFAIVMKNAYVSGALGLCLKPVSYVAGKVRENVYVAKQVGRYGELIDVPKIRTMYPGAELQLEEVVKTNGFAKDDKPKDDPRIMPSRRWIRRFFIDELPQILYNIIWKKI